MAHTAVEKKHEKYNRFNYMIRAKLFKGRKDGTMNMRTIFDDEKIKLQTGQICNYCGSRSWAWTYGGKNHSHITIHIHHIDGDNKNNTPENIIPLCALCHKKSHLKEQFAKQRRIYPKVDKSS